MIYYIKIEDEVISIFDENNKECPGTLEKKGADYLFTVTGASCMKKIKGYWVTGIQQNGGYIKVNSEGSKCTTVTELPTAKEAKLKIDKTTKKVIEELKKDVKLRTMVSYTFDDALFVPIKVGGVLDEFLSTDGGIYPGVKILVNGEAGTLKSSNMLQLLQEAKKQDTKKQVLYVSAEMGALDFKRSVTKHYTDAEHSVHLAFPGEYLNGDNAENITTTQYLINILNQGWDLVVLDSLIIIQQMIRQEQGFSSDSKAEQWILRLLDNHSKRALNKREVHTSFLMIQQSNRSGSIQGSAQLEYMINGTIELKKDKKDKGQYMSFKKNRSGEKDMRLYFTLSKTRGIVYDEPKYRAQQAFNDILSQDNEEGESMTGETLAELLNGAAQLKAQLTN